MNRGGGVFANATSLMVHNSIIFGNKAKSNRNLAIDGAKPRISCSDVEGCGGSGNPLGGIPWVSTFGVDGGGNIEDDPKFIDISDPDGADNVFGTLDDGLRLDSRQNPTSPCIDTASADSAPYLDILGIERKVHGQPGDDSMSPDMGAYECLAVLHVDGSAASSGNGSAWTSPYKYLTDALAASWTGCQIWVKGSATGITYYPDESVQSPNGTGIRTSSFQLQPNVDVYGGFAGTEIALFESAPAQRDWTANVTTLSGDIGTLNVSTDNSYHVVKGADNTILDGFTITGGKADGTGNDGYGGGMLNLDVSPTVSHCVFKGNAALYGGGAIFNCQSAPIIINGLFYDNSAEDGGAVYNYDLQAEQLLIQNCTFSKNTASQYAGAVFSDICDELWITNSIFWGNLDSTQEDYDILLYGGVLDLSYSDIHSYSYFTGTGAQISESYNIFGDPLFANAANNDFHLKSVSGRWTNSGFVYTDTVTSPCIQSGDGSLSCSMEPSPNGGKANMGFEGNTAQASKFTGYTITVTLLTDDGLSLPSGAGWYLVQAGVVYDGLLYSSGQQIELASGTYTIYCWGVDDYQTPTPLQITVNSSGAYSCTYNTLLRYVSTSGSDSYNGKTPQTAYRNISTGLTNVPYGGTVTVLFGTGTYNENLTAPTNKPYTLFGENKPVINGQGLNSVLKLVGVNSGVVIRNFTIQNGSAIRGGGIYIENCSPTIESCNITGNLATNAAGQALGGGIYISQGSPIIRLCNINNNNATGASGGGYGGGIYTYWTSARFEYCNVGTTTLNDVLNSTTHGDEIYTYVNPSYLNIRPCYNYCNVRGGLPGTYCQSYNNVNPYINCQ